MPQTRYPPHNTSNPFQNIQNNFGQPSLHQPSHLQHPNANLQHTLGGHPGFGAGGPNGGMNIFGPQTGNSGIPGAFGAGGALGAGGTGLASQAAQMGFAHGAALQQQQAHEAANAGAYPQKGVNARVREVWKHNLHQEFHILRQLVDRYPYISMVSDYSILKNIGVRFVVSKHCRRRSRSSLALCSIIRSPCDLNC
jgi:CCR4-NOT transcription complex subunit 7/8